MIRETISLIIRHALTAGGVILLLSNVTTVEDLQAFTDAALGIGGTTSIAVGLLWSWWREFAREKRFPHPAAKTGGNAVVALLATLGLGCSTVTVQDRDTGFLISRTSNAFSKSGIGKFKISITQDGTRIIEMTSYAQESADSWANIMASLTELAKMAAMAAAK